MIEFGWKFIEQGTMFATLWIYDVQNVLQGVTNNIRYTFSVSDTTWAVYN